MMAKSRCIRSWEHLNVEKLVQKPMGEIRV